MVSQPVTIRLPAPSTTLSVMLFLLNGTSRALRPASMLALTRSTTRLLTIRRVRRFPRSCNVPPRATTLGASFVKSSLALPSSSASNVFSDDNPFRLTWPIMSHSSMTTRLPASKSVISPCSPALPAVWTITSASAPAARRAAVRRPISAFTNRPALPFLSTIATPSTRSAWSSALLRVVSRPLFLKTSTSFLPRAARPAASISLKNFAASSSAPALKPGQPQSEKSVLNPLAPAASSTFT